MRRPDRERQLIEVAEAVFAERGYTAASMDEVAERAGITKPVLYDHFGSKDGLLAAVILRAGAEMRAAVGRAVADAASPEDALERGLRAYFAFIDRHAASWTVLLSEAAATRAGAEAMETVRREQTDFIAVLIAGEMTEHDADLAQTFAQAVIGACERLATYRTNARGLEVETVTKRLMELLWLGFGNLAAGVRRRK